MQTNGTVDGRNNTCVLVVEDEAMIALQLGTLLEDYGYRVIGPAANVRDALALAEMAPPDIAILDVRVTDGVTYPIAAVLRARSTPILFLTGYADDEIADEFRDSPCVQKPFSNAAVLGAVAALAARSERV